MKSRKPTAWHCYVEQTVYPQLPTSIPEIFRQQLLLCSQISNNKAAEALIIQVAAHFPHRLNTLEQEIKINFPQYHKLFQTITMLA